MSDDASFPGWKLWGTAAEFSRLADSWWQEAVDLGPAHKLSPEDRAYQRECFALSEDFHTRAVYLSAREHDEQKDVA